MPQNAFYAQSGGVTAVINASACGVIETARKHPHRIGKIYAGRNGIIGGLTEDLIDTSQYSDKVIAQLKHTPSAAFGSCRYKLKSLSEHQREYTRLIEVFKAHDIGYFFYNGGGDSQDTANKVAQISQQLGFPIQCIGVPKTIDNDLPLTDNCPGFGSVAKYVAVSILEAGLDVAAMCASSTKVFILEVMGRHAGWIAASAGLAKNQSHRSPHLILFPEIAFDEAKFCQAVQAHIELDGYCTIVASEGVKTPQGEFLSKGTQTDAFGHAQLGGVAPRLADLVKQSLQVKVHYAVADYLQRVARHVASATDVAQAYALGQAAVELALAGKSGVLPIIERTSNQPYQWKLGEAPLEAVANVEKKMPIEFIDETGFGITQACREYLHPLIQGESYPEYQDGLPQYLSLELESIPQKLAPFIVA